MYKKLEIGHKNSFETRIYSLQLGNLAGTKTMFLSDLHLNGSSAGLITNIINSLEEHKPDLVLLGGDYVDSVKGIKHLQTLLNTLELYSTFAILGNHDQWRFRKKVNSLFENSSVGLLEQKTKVLKIKNSRVQIDGNIEAKKEKEIDIHISLHHIPKVISPENQYDLVFAGHLHGGQCVLWKKNNKLYPAALFYSMNFLKKQIENCTYFISKGLGDTLPIRYNCKKDIILIQFI